MYNRQSGLTFLQAARAVLEELKQPLHFKKITELAIQRKLLNTSGKTPEWTMGARLSVDVKEKGLQSDFTRVGNGKYGLTKWRKANVKGIVSTVSDDPERQRYWLVSIDPENYYFDIDKGSLDTVGVKHRMRKTLARAKPGDKIIIYLKREAVFTAILNVEGETYIDESNRWPVDGEELSARIGVSAEIILDKEAHIDARLLYPALEIFNQYPEKHRTLALRNGISEISEEDYQVIREKCDQVS